MLISLRGEKLGGANPSLRIVCVQRYLLLFLKAPARPFSKHLPGFQPSWCCTQPTFNDKRCSPHCFSFQIDAISLQEENLCHGWEILWETPSSLWNAMTLGPSSGPHLSPEREEVREWGAGCAEPPHFLRLPFFLNGSLFDLPFGSCNAKMNNPHLKEDSYLWKHWMSQSQ